MELNNKNVVKGIGILIIIAALLKLRVGFYMSQLPVLLVMLIAGFACVYYSEKIVGTNPTDSNLSPSITPKWKCGCGSYNDLHEHFCSNCGSKVQ